MHFSFLGPDQNDIAFGNSVLAASETGSIEGAASVKKQGPIWDIKSHVMGLGSSSMSQKPS